MAHNGGFLELDEAEETVLLLQLERVDGIEDGMDFQKDSQLFLRGRVGVELVYGFIPINDKKHIITISPNDDSGV